MSRISISGCCCTFAFSLSLFSFLSSLGARVSTRNVSCGRDDDRRPTILSRFFVPMPLEPRDACPVCVNNLLVNTSGDKVLPMRQVRARERERVHMALRNASAPSFTRAAMMRRLRAKYGVFKNNLIEQSDGREQPGRELSYLFHHRTMSEFV